MKIWGAFEVERLAQLVAQVFVGVLRILLPKVPIYAASATLPPPILQDLKKQLGLRADTEVIHRSNDRPNISIVVRPLKFAANTFQDLDFLIPKEIGDDDPPPPKFLVFFDSKRDAERATHYLQSRLPLHLRNKVKWFHSTMSPYYREEEFEALRDRTSWGLCVTDAFGMVRDYFRACECYLSTHPTKGT